ncbi:hypothetical protein [Streptomyces sp. NBC_01233]|uniref:hypothetical protein n=1 Tax=Streptomyces sp. NBC_01233 TaxID=2903787 RepID=UPI002E0E5374|nr:hypothetical protein OG332_39290 [Streptomyces sp. NBC_01233]
MVEGRRDHRHADGPLAAFEGREDLLRPLDLVQVQAAPPVRTARTRSTLRPACAHARAHTPDHAPSLVLP